MIDELDEKEALAAEYVLGTLDLVDRRRARQMAASDPGFRRLVLSWEKRLAGISASVPEIAPPETVWDDIERELKPAADPEPKVVPIRPVETRAQPTLTSSLGFWRGATAVATGLAACLALFMVVSSPWVLDGEPQDYVAVMGEGDGRAAWIVSIDPANERMVIRPVRTDPVEERAMELWLVTEEGEVPRSLGLLDPGAANTVDLEPQVSAAIQPTSLLAISLEPPGGSPTGQPTGPVILHGEILSLPEDG